jgi:hypothetical protein
MIRNYSKKEQLNMLDEVRDFINKRFPRLGINVALWRECPKNAAMGIKVYCIMECQGIVRVVPIVFSFDELAMSDKKISIEGRIKISMHVFVDNLLEKKDNE